MCIYWVCVCMVEKLKLKRCVVLKKLLSFTKIPELIVLRRKHICVSNMKG